MARPRGNAAYDSYKTRAIAHAEQRRTKPGAAANFCKTADIVFAAALAPDKPVLEDFVAGVPVYENNPVDACEVKVARDAAGRCRRPDGHAQAAARSAGRSAQSESLSVTRLVCCRAASLRSFAFARSGAPCSSPRACQYARLAKHAACASACDALAGVGGARQKERAGLATGPFASDGGLISRRDR